MDNLAALAIEELEALADRCKRRDEEALQAYPDAARELLERAHSGAVSGLPCTLEDQTEYQRVFRHVERLTGSIVEDIKPAPERE